MRHLRSVPVVPQIPQQAMLEIPEQEHGNKIQDFLKVDGGPRRTRTLKSQYQINYPPPSLVYKQRCCHPIYFVATTILVGFGQYFVVA